MQTHDAIVLGAGAAGLYCGGIAAARGLRVAVIDHARAPGEKIRISGGGRCNFTNVNSGPHAFLSENPHFAKSALARHGPDAFIDLIRRHGIAFHEKTLGQLFCDGSAKQVVAMLVDELRGADLRLGAAATDIRLADDRFTIALSDGASVTAPNLIVATGGRSIPKMGASGFGYDLARRFGLAVTETRPALVPLTFGPPDLAWMAPLAGIAAPASVQAGAASFDGALLFTHRGLSGPAILQISSYWRQGQPITLRLLPDAAALLRNSPRRDAEAAAGHRAVRPPARPSGAGAGGATGRQRPGCQRSARPLGRAFGGVPPAPRRQRGLPHRRGDAGRRFHRRSRRPHHAGAPGAGAALHRRGGGRDRLAGRLQLSMGLVLGPCLRHRAQTERVIPPSTRRFCPVM